MGKNRVPSQGQVAGCSNSVWGRVHGKPLEENNLSRGKGTCPYQRDGIRISYTRDSREKMDWSERRGL